MNANLNQLGHRYTKQAMLQPGAGTLASSWICVNTFDGGGP